MRINNKGKGIYFHALKLPKDLQGRGIGRFCVDWLKDFSQKYGFEYIALGSYKRAEAFWEKMGFAKIDMEERIRYPID